jgi:hypothetical protein
VVDRLADARDELRGAFADPRASEVGGICVAAIRATSRRLAGPSPPRALTEPGRRRSLRQSTDSLDHGNLDTALLEPPHGSALHRHPGIPSAVLSGEHY